MADIEVVGLTEDGERLVLRVAGEHHEVALDEVHRAERLTPAALTAQAAQAAGREAAPTPKEIQQRIRGGEAAAAIARGAGIPVADVARYESPVLAERAHHARHAQQAEIDGQPVGELVAAHLGGDPDDISWDSWLTAPGRWEVQARAGERTVRLRWEPGPRRVSAADETSRRALHLAAAQDALTAVLRPVSSADPAPAAQDEEVAQEGAAQEKAAQEEAAQEEAAKEKAAQQEPDEAPLPAVPPAAVRPARRARAQVPLWEDISQQVSGREAGAPHGD